jgi:hypothetical protein
VRAGYRSLGRVALSGRATALGWPSKVSEVWHHLDLLVVETLLSLPLLVQGQVQQSARRAEFEVQRALSAVLVAVHGSFSHLNLQFVRYK